MASFAAYPTSEADIVPVDLGVWLDSSLEYRRWAQGSKRPHGCKQQDLWTFARLCRAGGGVRVATVVKFIASGCAGVCKCRSQGINCAWKVSSNQSDLLAPSRSGHLDAGAGVSRVGGVHSSH